MKKNGLKVTLHLKLAILLALVFFTILIMTTWWQYLFATAFHSHAEGRLKALENRALKIVWQTPEKLDDFLAEELMEFSGSCQRDPCVVMPQKGKEKRYLQITQAHSFEIMDASRRKINMIYWETSFLMFFLLLGIAYMIGIVLREKRNQQERQDFLAMTTHELKHPVSVISLVLDSLRRDTIPQERRPEFIEKGLSEVKALKRSLENLLKIQEISFSEKPSLKKIQLDGYLKSLEEFWKLHTLNQPQRLQFKSSLKEAGGEVLADPNSLDIIMNNLIENALLYSKDEVVVEAGSDQRGAFIETRDQGLGFTPEEKKKFQDMFYRSTRHNIQNIRGSGLGHYIIKGLVQKNRLQLELHSEGENQGSRFRLYLRSP